MTILILCLCTAAGMAVNTRPGAGNRLREEWFRTKMDNKKLPYSERLRYADSLAAVSSRNDIANVLIKKAVIATDGQQYKLASEILSKADRLIIRDSLKTRLRYHLLSGIVFYNMFDYRKTIDHDLSVLETAKPDSLIFFDINACLNIADVFMRLKKFDLAHKYNEKAMRIFEENSPRVTWPDNTYKSRILRSRSGIHIQEHDYDKALTDLKAAEQATIDTVEKKRGLINLGLVYLRMGLYDMAEEQFRSYLSSAPDGENRAICVMNYVSNSINAGDMEKAINVKETYAADLASLEDGVLSPLLRIIDAQIAEYQGDKDKAIRYWGEAYTLNDSILSAQGNIYLNEIMSDFENRERDLESGRVLRGSRTKSVIIYGLCGIVALLGAGGWCLWRRHRRRNQENEELESAIADLDRSHKEEVREAEEELDSKNQQLSAIALHMERIKDTIDYIAQQAGDRHGDKEDRLSNIRGRLKELQMQENVWGMFNTYFEQANRSFFDKLHRICPALTNAELRLCAFILANMTTKEIAMMTNRSIRTVETTRYNLRKKLNMKIPTEEYLRNVAIADDEAIQEMRGMCNCTG